MSNCVIASILVGWLLVTAEGVPAAPPHSSPSVNSANADSENPDTATAAAAVDCVLLRTGQVLRGTALREGSIVRIRRGKLSEITIPANRVLHIAAGDDELYRFVRRQNPPHTIRSAVELIGWSLDRELVSQATAELRMCQTLFPENAELKRLQDRIDRSQLDGKSEMIESPNQMEGSAVQTVGYETEFESPTQRGDGSDDPATADRSNLMTHGSAESRSQHSALSRHFVEFNSLVLPTLVARCGQCHASQQSESSSLSQKSGFVLRVPLSGRRTDAGIAQWNYQRLTDYLHDAQAAGRFLQYATTVHDTTTEKNFNFDSLPPSFLQAPRMGNTLYRMERWCVEAVRNQSQSKQTNSQSPSPENAPHIDHGDTNPPVQPSGNQSVELKPLTIEADETKVTRLPRVQNPHDPAAFNQISKARRSGIH